jgi:spermidine synthase
MAALSVLLVVGWLWQSSWRRVPELAVGAACAVAVVALPGNAQLWSRLHLTHSDPALAWAEDRSGVSLFRATKRLDGLQEGPFFIQGFSQGQIPFLSIHQFLGAIGPLVHPDPRNVLVIGVGSGGTPWAAGVLPQTNVRAVELVGPVLRVHAEIARRSPDGPIARMLADRRWRIEYGDGRRTLAKEETRYDIIEADAILPEGSLSGLLYSREFLELVRRRLAPGGLYVQWTPTCRIVDTFRNAFPHSVLILPARVMIGSDVPVPIAADVVARRFANPGVVAHLASGNPDVSDYSPFMRVLVTPSRDGRFPDEILTDLYPRDEFFLNNDRRGFDASAFEAPRTSGTPAPAFPCR